jgi:ribose transport system ATP-binding protein
VYQPDEGLIRIDGKETTIRAVSDAAASGIGFVHQELNVLDNLSVGENVFLGREPVWGSFLRLIDREKLHAETEIYLKRLGLNISSRTPSA